MTVPITLNGDPAEVDAGTTVASLLNRLGIQRRRVLVEHNRRVLDGELTGLGSLPAGSVIRITVAIAVDGRLTVTAREPRSGRELTLEAYVEGVIDSAEAERLTTAVGLIAVRG